MKFLLIAAAVVAVAVAGPTRFILPDVAGPAPIIDFNPNDVVSVHPVIVDESPISVGPAIVDESPISVGPAIIDDSIVSEGANYQGPTPPLVQVIVNVNSKAPTPNNPISKPQPLPVLVPEDIYVEKPEPVIVAPIIVPEESEVKPEPVIVAPIIVPEEAEVKPEPVIVAPIIVPEDSNVKPEPVIIAPIEPTPVINLPDILN